MDAPLRGVPRGGRPPGRGRLTEPTTAEPAAVAPQAGPQGIERLGRRLLIPLALGLLAAIGLVLAADARKMAERLQGFDWTLLAPMLGLSLANYGLRFARWQVYLARLGVTLSRGRSLAVFLVGFLLSVTPGKAGELGKAWLVRELGGGRALPVVSAVLAERVTDLLGVLVLLALGALPFPGGGWVAAAVLAAVAGAVLVLSWERGAAWLFRLLARLPWIGRRTGALADVYARLRSLLDPRLLAFALAVSVVAWGAEGLAFVLAVRQYDPGAGVLAGVFNYSLSTCIGSLSMLPGGLLAAEGMLTALLDAQGLDTAAAAAATLIIRGTTLWFAVLLGLLALPFVARWLAARRSAGA